MRRVYLKKKVMNDKNDKVKTAFMIATIIISGCLLHFTPYDWNGCLDIEVESLKDSPRILTKTEISALYKITKIVTTLLNDFRIPWILNGGSLLCQKRNVPPGPCQYDDDVDIGILGTDIDKFWNHPNLYSDTIIVERVFFGLTFRLKEYEGKIKKLNYLDIFGYHLQESNDTLKYFIANSTTVWSKDYFDDEKDFIDSETCKFWNLTLKCPKNYNHYLIRNYGNNWMEQAIIWNHNNDEKKFINLTETPSYKLPLKILDYK